MDRRLQLQKVLEDLMHALHPTTLPDARAINKFHVYFQPPENVSITYPAIVYERNALSMTHANNNSYHREKQYQITVIDRNPDSAIPDAVASLPKTRFVAHNKADGLNHDVYTTYF